MREKRLSAQATLKLSTADGPIFATIKHKATLRVFIMMTIPLFVSFLLVVVLVSVIVYGRTLSRKAKSETDKNFIARFFIMLVLTFAAGGIARTFQQNAGPEWLNGFVLIFGGLFVSLWGVPFFWRINKDKMNGLKGFLVFLPGSFFILAGLIVIYLGITQVWKALW